MIAKISKAGSNFYGAARYNQQKIDKGEGRVIGKNMIANTAPKQLDRNLKMLSSYGNVKNPVFHASLSFSPNDKLKLTDGLMRKIGDEYMDKMGYGKQPYVIYRHTDTAHPHIHILSTKVDIGTQKRIKDSFNYYQSVEVTMKLEQKYDLTAALKQTKAHKAVREAVQAALKKGPVNYKQLNQALKRVGSPHQVREAGRGIVYYKVDEGGKRNSKSWKGSDFKKVGLDKKGLKEAFELNRFYRSVVKEAVNHTLKQADKMPLAQFEKSLAKYNITPKYAINAGGVYGVSFNYKDRTMKASDIDKGLSWNKLKDRLDIPSYINEREQLKVSISQGQSISSSYNNRKVVFSSPNKVIETKLNNMKTQDAFDLVDLHKKYSEKLSQATGFDERKLIKSMAGNDIDEYLQKQYEIRQVMNQRQRKIGW